MMMKNLRFSILTAAVAVSASAIAQQTLTLEQCKEMALKANAEIAAATKQTESAEYTAKSYRSNYYPNIYAQAYGLYSTAEGSKEFEISGGALPVYPDASFMQNPAVLQTTAPQGFAYFPGGGFALDYEIGTVIRGGISLEQPIYQGGKIKASTEMAELGVSMSQKNEVLTRSNVIYQTETAYALLVQAIEMQKVATAYYQTIENLMKDVRSAVKHSMRLPADSMQVLVKLGEGELSVRKAENAIRLARMNLCHYIGLPLDTEVNPTDELPETSEGNATVTDISARPESAILDSRAEMAEKQVKLDRSNLLPSVGLLAGYNYMHGIKVNDNYLLNSGSFSVLLNVKIPITHFGANTNKVRSAKAKRDQTILERQNLQEQMTLELQRAINTLDEAHLNKEIAERQLNAATENMRIQRSRYNNQLSTTSELLEAQTLWQQALQGNVQAAFDLYIADIAYRKAAGILE